MPRLSPAGSVVLTLLLATPVGAQDAPDPRGDWVGELEVPGGSLTIVFHLSRDEAGGWSATMDSPDQGAMGIPVGSVSVDGDLLELTVPAVAGRYEGTLEGGRITGAWHQGGASLPLTLRPATVEDLSPPERPQEPEPPPTRWRR